MCVTPAETTGERGGSFLQQIKQEDALKMWLKMKIFSCFSALQGWGQLPE